MTVRAKFRCDNVIDCQGWNNQQPETKVIYMSPVTSGKDEENNKFFKYTPGGQLTLYTVNPSAAEYFEKGKEYYLDFSKVGE